MEERRARLWLFQLSPRLVREAVVSILAIVACLMVYSLWSSGSASRVPELLRGERIAFEPSVVPAQTVQPNELVEVPVRVRNLTRHQITITGARANCSCIDAGSMPIRIDPQNEVQLSIRWRIPDATGTMNETIQYYFSQGETWSRNLALVAHVVAEPKRLRE